MSAVLDSMPSKRRRVYELLRDTPGMTLRQIAGVLGVAGPTVHEHIKYLERDGLVHRPGRHWVTVDPTPWLGINGAPHDGRELILLCPSERVHKVVFGAYRPDHGRGSVPRWRERNTGFVVEPVGYMPMPQVKR